MRSMQTKMERLITMNFYRRQSTVNSWSAKKTSRKHLKCLIVTRVGKLVLRSNILNAYIELDIKRYSVAVSCQNPFGKICLRMWMIMETKRFLCRSFKTLLKTLENNLKNDLKFQEIKKSYQRKSINFKK